MYEYMDSLPSFLLRGYENLYMCDDGHGLFCMMEIWDMKRLGVSSCMHFLGMGFGLCIERRGVLLWGWATYDILVTLNE